MASFVESPARPSSRHTSAVLKIFEAGDFDILNRMFFTLNITRRNSLKRMQKLRIQNDRVRVARNDAKEHVELTEKKEAIKNFN